MRSPGDGDEWRARFGCQIMYAVERFEMGLRQVESGDARGLLRYALLLGLPT